MRWLGTRQMMRGEVSVRFLGDEDADVTVYVRREGHLSRIQADATERLSQPETVVVVDPIHLVCLVGHRSSRLVCMGPQLGAVSSEHDRE